MIGSRFGAARLVSGRKDGLKLALLKVGVEVVLRIGSYLQNRARSRQMLVRTRQPAG